MSEKAWIRSFQNAGALWLYEGEPSPDKPHGEMTSGKHSNGFFNASLVIKDPHLLNSACSELSSLIGGKSQVSWVIGSAMGAVTIAYQMWDFVDSAKYAGFTEKVVDDMVLKRFSLEPDSQVLVVEDVMTTGGTTRKTIAAIERAGGQVIDTIGVLVNRSGMVDLDGRKIVALIERELPLWESENCPYCKIGSKALRPKEHWHELVGNTSQEK